MKRITLADIAERTGFSKSAVSAALKNHPRMGRETAELIRKTAREMNYSPDPVFSEMGRKRWKRGGSEAGENLVFLRDQLSGEGEDGELEHLIEHALSKGYRLQPRFVGDYKDVRQADREFLARGVRGVMTHLARPQSERFLMELRTEHLAVVTEEADLDVFHSISRNWGGMVSVLVRKMVDRGYRTISIILHENEPLRYYDEQRLGTVMVLQRRLPCTIHLHTIKDSWGKGSALNAQYPAIQGAASRKKQLREVLERDRPDAVIGWSTSSLFSLRELGVKVPDDLGYAALVDTGESSGMASDLEYLWKAQLDKLVEQIRNTDFGRPDRSMITSFIPEFIDAGTF